MSDTIKVAVRVRPLLDRELQNQIHWAIEDNVIYQTNENKMMVCEPYSFDKIFDKSKDNRYIYKDSIHNLVTSALNGFNSTIFAYGQTSSGKTHTMTGSQNSLGIMQLAVADIFNTIEQCTERKYLIRVSYIEIYNEKINDLLENTGIDLKVREDREGNHFVNAREDVASNSQHVFNLMRQGNKTRKIGSTDMNERSSRSHTILKIIIESTPILREGDQTVQLSNLNFVDLAGSERIAQTKAAGVRRKEGVHINMSLSTLCLVIRQLSEGERFINFRDSKLTRLLQHALGGNAKTLIIANVTIATLDETNSTLLFAKSAKAVKNKPVINKVITVEDKARRYEALSSQYKSELELEMKNKSELQEKMESRDRLIKELVQKLDAIENFNSSKIQLTTVKRRHTISGSCDKNTTDEVVFKTPQVSQKIPGRKNATNLNTIVEQPEHLSEEELDQLAMHVTPFRSRVLQERNSVSYDNLLEHKLKILEKTISEKNEQLDKKDKELAFLKTNRHSLSNCDVELLESKIISLETDLLETNQTMDLGRVKIISLEKELSKALKQVEDKNSLLNQKIKELNSKEKEISNFKSNQLMIRELQQALHEAHKELANKNHQCTNLETSFETLKEFTKLEANFKSEEVEMLVKNNKSLQDKVNDMEKQLRIFEENHKKLKKDNADLQCINSQLPIDFQVQIDQMKTNYQKKETLYVDRINELESKTSSADTYSKVTNQLDNLRQEFSCKTKQYEEEITNLKKVITLKNNEIKERDHIILEYDAQVLEAEMEPKGENTDFEDIQKQLLLIKDVLLGDISSEVVHISVQVDLNRIEETQDNVYKKLDDLTIKYNEEQFRLKSSNEEIDSLKSNLKRVNDEFIYVSTKYENLQQTSKNLTEQNNDISDKYQNLTKTLVEELETTKEILSDQRFQHQQDIQSYEEKLNHLNNNFSCSIKKLTNELQEKNDRLENVLAKTVEYCKQIEDDAVKIKTLELKIDEQKLNFGNDIANKNQELEMCNKELKDYINRVKLLESEFCCNVDILPMECYLQEAGTNLENDLVNKEVLLNNVMKEKTHLEHKVSKLESNKEKIMLKEQILRSNEQLATKDSFLSTVNNDKSTLKDKISMLEQQVAEKDSSLRDINKEKLTLEDKLSCLEQQIESLNNVKTEKISLENRISMLNEQLAEKEFCLNNMANKEKIMLKEQILRLNEQLATKDSFLSTVNNDKSTLKDKISMLEQQVAEKDSSLRDINKEKLTLEDKLSCLEQEIESLNNVKTEKISLENRISMLNEQLAEKEFCLNNMSNKEKIMLKDQILRLNEELATKNSFLSIVNNEKSTLENKVSMLEQQVTEKDLSLCDFNKQKITLEDKMSCLEQQMASLNNVKTEKIILENKISLLNEQLAEKECCLNNLMIVKTNLEKEICKFKKNDCVLNSLVKEKTGLEDQIVILNRQLTVANTALLDVDNNKATLEDKILSLEQQVASLNIIKNEKSTLENNIKMLKQQLTEKDLSLNNIMIIRSNLEKEILRLNEQVTAKDSSLHDVNKENVTLVNKISRLEQQVSSLNNVKIEKSNLEDKILMLEQQLVATDMLLQDVNKDKSILKEKTVNLEQQVASLNTIKNGKSTLENKIKMLEQQLAERDLSLNNMIIIKTNLEKDIAKLKENDCILNSLMKEKTNLEDEILKLNYELTTKDSTLSDVNKKNAIFKDKITMLDQQVIEKDLSLNNIMLKKNNLETEISILKDHTDCLIKEKANLENKILRLNEQVAASDSSLHNVKKENAALEEKNSRFEQEVLSLNNVKNEKSTLEDKILMLEQQLVATSLSQQDVNKDHPTFKEKILKLEQQVTEKDLSLNNMNIVKTNLEKEISKLKNSIIELDKIKSAHTKTILDLQNKINEMLMNHKKQLENLHNELELKETQKMKEMGNIGKQLSRAYDELREADFKNSELIYKEEKIAELTSRIMLLEDSKSKKSSRTSSPQNLSPQELRKLRRQSLHDRSRSVSITLECEACVELKKKMVSFENILMESKLENVKLTTALKEKNEISKDLLEKINALQNEKSNESDKVCSPRNISADSMRKIKRQLLQDQGRNVSMLECDSCIDLLKKNRSLKLSNKEKIEELVKLNALVGSLNQEIDMLKKFLDKDDIKVEQLQRQISLFGNNPNAEKIKEMDVELFDVKKKLESMTKKYNDAMVDVNKLIINVNNLDKENRKLTAEKDLLEKSETSLEHIAVKLKQRTECQKCIEFKTKMDFEVSHLKGELETMRKQYQQEKKQSKPSNDPSVIHTRNNKKEIEDLQTKNKFLENRLFALQSRIKSIENISPNKCVNCIYHTDTINELQLSLLTKTTNITKLKNSVLDWEKKYNRLLESHKKCEQRQRETVEIAEPKESSQMKHEDLERKYGQTAKLARLRLKENQILRKRLGLKDNDVVD